MNTKQGHSLSQYLHLNSHQISTGVAIFYVGYLLFDVPFNLVMTKLAPQVWLSRIVITIGIVATCHVFLSHAWNFYLLRFLLGVAEAGLWPGMAYYLTLFYPPSRCARLIGLYFTAAQVSAAVVGLVSAGFQLMDGAGVGGGLTGYEWMFLLYGIITILGGIASLWWLPDRLLAPDAEPRSITGWRRWLPRQKPVLVGEDARIHYEAVQGVYHPTVWTVHDLWKVLLDPRVWPLVMMYFGVVGVGIGVQNYGTIIIKAINPKLTDVQLSLLFAPIWVMDGIAILLITPVSDRFPRHRPHFFAASCLVIAVGLLITTFAPHPWPRYIGLLFVGFGLGPTVPICMTWTSEIFHRRHGEVGVAAATALVSGLGNLGSVTTTYALYTGYPADKKHGYGFRNSNLIMVGILGVSILSGAIMELILRLWDRTVDNDQLASQDDNRSTGSGKVDDRTV